MSSWAIAQTLQKTKMKDDFSVVKSVWWFSILVIASDCRSSLSVVSAILSTYAHMIHSMRSSGGVAPSLIIVHPVSIRDLFQTLGSASPFSDLWGISQPRVPANLSLLCCDILGFGRDQFRGRHHSRCSRRRSWQVWCLQWTQIREHPLVLKFSAPSVIAIGSMLELCWASTLSTCPIDWVSKKS